MRSSLPLPAALAFPVWIAGAAVLHAQAPPAPAAKGLDRTIAVTVDDLPVNGRDPGVAGLKDMNDRLLAALKRHGVPALGFLNESKLYAPGEVDGRIALLEAWLDQGLELGNHTWSHASFNRVGQAAFQEEVMRGETVTRLILQRRQRPRLRYFRHPFLDAGPTEAEKIGFESFLAARGYIVAPVTVDAWDWYYSYRYAIARRRSDPDLMKKVADAYLAHLGAALDYSESFSERLFGRPIPHVLLMHENELAADDFDRVAALFKERGYRFVSLEEALADPAYRHPERFIGGGVNWFVRWATAAGLPDLPRAPRPPDWLEQMEADRSPYDPAR